VCDLLWRQGCERIGDDSESFLGFLVCKVGGLLLVKWVKPKEEQLGDSVLSSDPPSEGERSWLCACCSVWPRLCQEIPSTQEWKEGMGTRVQLIEAPGLLLS
jgi:hypothetical protein